MTGEAIAPHDMDDAQLSAHLAYHAGRILLAVRTSGVFPPQALGVAGDQTANQFLCHAIRTLRPDDGLLSEENWAGESRDIAERLGKSRVWIIDPVDGSREYGEERPDWAVHVGLAIDGAPVIGAVALPGFGSGTGNGLVLRTDEPRPVPPPPPRLRLVVSRTRPAHEAVRIAEKLGAELVPMGSAGAKAMAVVRGEADIYLHSGGQYEWDSCAPAAVALAHGLHASRIDGSALLYNQPGAWLPDIVICHKHIAPQILALLKESGA